MSSHQLERYSFLWSEARLLIAALALFLGGVPPVYLLFRFTPGFYGTITPLLKLAWIISGLVSIYLLYRWQTAGKKVFGKKNPRDTTAFFVNIISGLNLGIVGIFGRNIGMSISSNYFVFIVVAVIYVIVAAYLWQRWNMFGKKVF